MIDPTGGSRSTPKRVSSPAIYDAFKTELSLRKKKDDSPTRMDDNSQLMKSRNDESKVS